MTYEEAKTVSIVFYMLFVIVIPSLFIILNIVSIVYIILFKKGIFEKDTLIGYLNKVFFEFLFIVKKKFLNNRTTKESLLEKLIKISPSFYIQITALTYLIVSTIFLLLYTAGDKYTFAWKSTWLNSTIIKIYSIPINFIKPDYIPNELSQEATKTLQGANSESWLWFLILLTMVWIFIPRVALSIFYYFKLKKDLKESFLENGQNTHIINTIKPNITTTHTMEEVSLEKDTKPDFAINMKINDSLNQTVIFWQLPQTTLNKLYNSKEFNNKNKIDLKSVSDLDKYTLTNNKEIIILINSNAPLKQAFKNLLNKIDVSYKFKAIYINENGDEIEPVKQWDDYIKERNEK